mmetsp:Transcript_494/g.1046  ORF Transcript_494/g.1046 Transcript_494/m.1046 type:complete len:314 (-) Transcript_494:257-1198(-)|eukprot:CAMPEP_0173385266 /NCGR_PEP_ID=MMETSP1356-20130122/7866_1 /TAXON_ID=77927 ORGANISM="Hemiselmis virescens, Strain PCC157" /NCGR_SAMPLE_ID=MMETSP1356 /ASSEMBLY_ACC=CAM_ASM_000847 /LENGTH=313 /DNA_ID=CAMNT_0014340987 /DNA_START=58 /DNA_END=999 /DNA_ORIENTATION=-
MPVEKQDVAVGPAVAKLRERLSKFDTEEGRRKGLALSTVPSDIIISTSPKAGTTWVQQIVQQLRSGGSMDYEEISMEIPFIEVAYDLGQDLTTPQRYTPRAFKTHLYRPHCPAGARNIVVTRDPVDVALSFFKFFEGWFFAPGEVPLDEFVREFWLARGEPSNDMENASFFHHTLSWWSHRKDPDVLFLFFEDLKEDLESNVSRIADFLKLPNDSPEVRALAVEHSTFDYMSAHKQHFDERLAVTHRNGPCGLPPDAGTVGKVRTGASGGGKKELSEATLQAIEARWREIVEPVTGFTTYAEMREASRAERGA